MMRKNIIAIIVVLLVGVGAYFYIGNISSSVNVPGNQATSRNQPGSTTSTIGSQVDTTKTVIGKSIEGRDITAYHYGTGDKELLFVGGIHGGYEWNTVLVAYNFMDYLKTNSGTIPSSVRVTIIPALNPDGLSRVVSSTTTFTVSDVSPSQVLQISGRFNGNTVDLNRNFDCDWKADATWQNKTVSGGAAPFSEPESQAIRDYVAAHNPTAAVVWYSASGGVFASNCHNGVSSSTQKITDVYAKASGYPAYKSFNFYEITGDMVNWLAKNNIPAISVLLSTHTDIEWDKNLSGIKALLQHYAQ